MQNFVPYEKLSKKKKRELDRARRGSWHGLDPVTRTKESAKVYTRKRSRSLYDDDGSGSFFAERRGARSKNQGIETASAVWYNLSA